MAKFSDVELAMIAIIFDEEQETDYKLKKRKWVHETWKKIESEGEFATLYKELIGDVIKNFQYFRMSEKLFGCDKSYRTG